MSVRVCVCSREEGDEGDFVCACGSYESECVHAHACVYVHMCSVMCVCVNQNMCV